MFKRLKDLTIGVLIGSLLFCIVPTIANTVKNVREYSWCKGRLE